jgi:large conductance mechanosensitive channel
MAKNESPINEITTSAVSLVSQFKAFILRGNVVDLAVGVVIGGAFGTVVKAFTEDILTPLIGLPSRYDLSVFTIKIRHTTFHLGDFVNSIVAFVILAFFVFIAVVKPVNYLMTYGKKDAAPTTKECPECLTLIAIGAKRCPACTSILVESDASN